MASTLSGLQGKAVMHAMTKKAEGMLEPLLEDSDEDSVSSDESDESTQYSTASHVSVKVTRTPEQMLKTGLVTLGLGVGVAASIGAMVLAPVAAVFIMGGVAITNVPYAAFKEHRIIKLPTLKEMNNQLKAQANSLKDDIDALEEEIDSLEPEAARAATIEAELKDIADEQHYNVEKFVSLVKENAMLLEEMNDNLRQRIVQDILRIVMSSDKDKDGRFSVVETKMLILKISLQLGEYGVEFDELKFFKVMSVDPSVPRTIEIVKRLIPDLNEDRDDRPEEEEKDTADMYGLSDDDYDMFHMVEADNSCTVDNPKSLSLSVTKRRSLTKPHRRPDLSRSEGVRKEKEEEEATKRSLQQAETRAARQEPAPPPRKRDILKTIFQ